LADSVAAEDIAGLDVVNEYVTGHFGQIGAYANASFMVGDFTVNNIGLDLQALTAPIGMIGGVALGGALEVATDALNDVLANLGEGASDLADEAITLFHGTDAESALGIVQDGLNLEKALVSGGDGSFWTTTAVEDAEQFAVVNPAGGSPAVVQVQVPAKLINNLVNDGLLTINDSVYQFAAGAYDRLNEFATFLLKS
jgi:hypothetical protein